MKKYLLLIVAFLLGIGLSLIATSSPASAATVRPSQWLYGEGTPGGCANGGPCVRQYVAGSDWRVDSPNHQYMIVWRGIGELQVQKYPLDSAAPIWRSNTRGTTLSFYSGSLSCQVAIKNSAGIVIWHSSVYEDPPAHCMVQGYDLGIFDRYAANIYNGGWDLQGTVPGTVTW